ncbi:MAG: hypothetical protein ACKORL_03610, partial [Phycisphaerales bacterium]
MLRSCPSISGALAAFVAGLAVVGCTPRALPDRPDGNASPGSARGTLPAVLTASPVISTREWKWRSVSGLEIATQHWVIRSSLRSANFTGGLPAFYEAALRNYRTGLVPLPAPPRRLEACVFGTREEWARYTEHRLARGGEPAAAHLQVLAGIGTEAVLGVAGPLLARAEDACLEPPRRRRQRHQ